MYEWASGTKGKAPSKRASAPASQPVKNIGRVEAL
jgi:hypothetical protein